MSTAPQTTSLIRSTAEFARYVGLSRSAVSRVLNKQPGLRPATIEKVRKAIEETGFTLNAHALHLRGKSANLIGVCMETLGTAPDVNKLSVFQNLLQERGYSTLIEVLKQGTSEQTIQHFLSMRVSGIVFIGHFDTGELKERISQLIKREMPYLVVNQSGIKSAHTVSLDRTRAMREVTGHLLDLGHRSFGLLGFSGEYQTIVDRLKGVRQAFELKGLDMETCAQSLDYLYPRTSHFEFGRKLATSFLKLPELPTAFLAVNDETAVGAMQEFQAAGLRFPEDLSMVGFNNENICLMTRPCLSSVDQQIDRTMEEASKALLGQMANNQPRKPIQCDIPPVFVERGTTGPARR